MSCKIELSTFFHIFLNTTLYNYTTDNPKHKVKWSFRENLEFIYSLKHKFSSNDKIWKCSASGSSNSTNLQVHQGMAEAIPSNDEEGTSKRELDTNSRSHTIDI